KSPAMPIGPVHHRRDAEPMCLVSHDFSTIKYDAAMQGPVMSATSATFITYISVRPERPMGDVPSDERRAALLGASAHSGAQTGEVQALAARLTAAMPRWFDVEPTHSGGDKPKLPTSTFVLPCGGENTNVSGEKTGLDFHLNTLVWTVSP